MEPIACFTLTRLIYPTNNDPIYNLHKHPLPYLLINRELYLIKVTFITTLTVVRLSVIEHNDIQTGADLAIIFLLSLKYNMIVHDYMTSIKITDKSIELSVSKSTVPKVKGYI